MKQTANRVISLLLALAMCLWIVPQSALAAPVPPDAMSISQVEKLLNDEPVYPQKTGYPELDRMIAELLANCSAVDTFGKLKHLYDWTVVNVDYDWDGYSQTVAPAYDKFTLTYDLEYEDGRPEVYPKDMIYRAYHMLTTHTGVCYDWGILFCIMARYVGLESYVRTGILHINSWQGHHGWTGIRLGGVEYIFDPQQDNRQLKDLHSSDFHQHFGIAPEKSQRFVIDAAERAVNDDRDAQIAPRNTGSDRVANVTVKVSRSGKVEGAGTYPWGEQVVLTAIEDDRRLVGWYDAKGNYLSDEAYYVFTPRTGNVTIQALFDGDLFIDVSEGWYFEDMKNAVERGLIYGNTGCTFDPNGGMSRAALTAILARISGQDLSAAPAAPFTDVDQDSWYAASVNWAYAKGVVRGVSETEFDPNAYVDRQQAAMMIVRFYEKAYGYSTGRAPDMFTDHQQVSKYAWYVVGAAYEYGFISGYPDGTFRPRQLVSRAEGVSMVMRMVNTMEKDPVLPRY